jgi:hypothetical protein
MKEDVNVSHGWAKMGKMLRRRLTFAVIVDGSCVKAESFVVPC